MEQDGLESTQTVPAADQTFGYGTPPHVAPPAWSTPAATLPPVAPAPLTSPAPWEAPPVFPSPRTADDAAPRKTGRVVSLFLAAFLGAVLGAGATLAANYAGFGKGGSVNIVAPPVPGGSKVSTDGVAGVAQAVGPSIVQIRTQIQDQFGQTGTGTGSGVIYRSDGYIITNNHVIQGATSVTVTLSNGDSMTGTVVGTAMPVDDIAVVKVDRKDLPVASLGSILNTKVGETAIAIGSPFGFQSTVTSGIVSALHRNIDLGGERFTEAIQTDAAINPGNSGGALVNGKGALIGIPTAIVGGQGGNVGIGFAIPVDIAKRDADEIIEKGHASRPLLGVTPATVPGQDGAYVAQVSGTAPAGQAGIRQGDLITAINGKVVHSGEELILALVPFRVGDKVTVTFKSHGATRTVSVVLASRTQ